MNTTEIIEEVNVKVEKESETEVDIIEITEEFNVKIEKLSVNEVDITEEVDVKVEKESNFKVEIEIEISPYHVTKEEIVAVPVVHHQAVKNTNHSEDASRTKKARIEIKKENTDEEKSLKKIKEKDKNDITSNVSFNKSIAYIRMRKNFEYKQQTNQTPKTLKNVFKCNHCDYKSVNKSDLIKHLRIHFDEKLYACSFCEYKCSNSQNFKTHLRIHTGEKSFSCSFCEYKCLTKNSLTLHLRVHTGEKPYSCSYCEYKCTNSSSLRTHLRIHSGEKPYSCHVFPCEFKTRGKSSLTRHLRLHASEKPHSCTLCEYKPDGAEAYSCPLCTGTKDKITAKTNLTPQFRTYARKK